MPARKKSSAKRPKRAPKKAASRQPPVRRWWSWRFIGQLSLVLLVVAGVATAFLDAWVQKRFDSHQWQLPARVYARPVELYQGRQLSRDHLTRLLGLMRYRQDGRAAAPGSYALQSSRLLLHTRGFSDSDGGEPARLLSLELRDNRLQSVVDSRQPDKQIVARLEPVQIGSIHPRHHEDRVLVRLDDVPPLFIGMLLATEDRAFHEHHGISLRGLARAMMANLKAGRLQQGGSTLTQQLVKNFWLTRERTLARKLVEIPMALLLELHYSKEDILEAYLNEVYLGQNGARAIHGVGLAARFYFGRPLEELQPHQMAMLVGLLKGPSYYDPRRHTERALKRRDTVLFAAYEQGLLDGAAMAAARGRSLDVVPRGSAALYAFPAFVDLVRRQLARDYPEEVLSSEGLQIHSTLDVLSQYAAEAALARHLKNRDSLNGAVVVTAPHQGDVLALVGDRQARRAGFNRALDAVRPIGSLAKPAVVLAALESGRTLATRVVDGAVEVRMEDGQVWRPQNYDGESRGSMPLVDALAMSRNQAIARVGLDVGLASVLEALQRLGVQRDIPPYPSVMLGSLALSPFEVAVMYQTLATGGFRTPLRAITDILDKDGQPLGRYPVNPEQVVDEAEGFLMQWSLRQVVLRGTGQSALRQLPADMVVAGKTGTSDGNRDAWFAGFSGDRLAVVWLGADDNSETRVSGASGPLPIWTDLMAELSRRPLVLAPPAGVSMTWLDADGKRLSGKGCDGAREYPVRDAYRPRERSSCGTVDAMQQGVFKWFRGLFD
jgi:penicillin-binding protein 1B